MAKKIENWNSDEFVNWDEFIPYTRFSGDERERNWAKCEALKIPESERCPICEREVKSSYKTLRMDLSHGETRLCFNPNAPGTIVKVGSTCFRHLQEAKIAKYGH